MAKVVQQINDIKKRILNFVRSRKFSDAMHMFYKTFSPEVPPDTYFVTRLYGEFNKSEEHELGLELLNTSILWLPDDVSLQQLQKSASSLCANGLISKAGKILLEREDKARRFQYKLDRTTGAAKDLVAKSNQKVLNSLVQEALDCLLKAYNLTKNSLKAVNMIITCYKFLNDEENAAKYDKISEQIRRETLNLIASEDGTTTETSKIIEKDNIKNHFREINNLLKDEKYLELIQIIDSFAEVQRLPVPFLLIKAKAFLKLKQFNKADQVLFEADRYNTHLKEIQQLKNEAFDEKLLVLTEVSASYLERALQLGPVLGLVFFQKAERCLKKALLIHPKSLTSLDNLYTVKRFLKHEAEAIQIKVQINEIDPTFVTSYDTELRKSFCFIASYAYPQQTEKVDVFRYFRQEYLFKYNIGNKLNDLYIKYSPLVIKLFIMFNIKPIICRILLFPLLCLFTILKYCNKQKVISVLFLFFFLFLPIVAPAFDSEEITVMLEQNNFTTFRAQALMGNWNITLLPILQKDTSRPPQTEPQKTSLAEGEDMVLLLTSKGLILKLSGGFEIDYGYSDIILENGSLLSVEYPGRLPTLIEGKIHFDIYKERLRTRTTLSLHKFIVASLSTLTRSPEIEALQAMAIMLRTRLLYLKEHSQHEGEDYEICATHHCLPYSGCTNNRELVKAAVFMTENIIMKYKNNLFLPRYHNTCGGKISSAKDVYGLEEPWHTAKDDCLDEDKLPLLQSYVPNLPPELAQQQNPFPENCFHSPSFHWSYEVSNEDILDFLSYRYAAGAEFIVTSWKPVEYDQAKRLNNVKLDGLLPKEVRGENFLFNLQRFFGINSIRSMRFEFERTDETTIFKGMGDGHGVGMCLYGADGMAKKQKTAEEILHFYYTGITLR